MLRLVPAAALVLAVTACGARTPPPLPDACTGDPGAVLRALRAAPATVHLADGTQLWRCIRDADSDAELQNVGLSFHLAAEQLRVRAMAGGANAQPAALELGYLIGATRRGAQRTNGLLAELVRRVELVGGRLESDAPPLAATVERGLAAGQRPG